MPTHFDQSITAQVQSMESYEEQILNIYNVNGLLDNSLSNERILIYADVGMGKTTLLRHVARLWLQKSEAMRQYKLVFLVPMRLIKSYSLIDIICNDLKLIPVRCKDKLQQSLNLKSNNVLFLLDDYEELSPRNEEIDRLIRGQLLQNSTLIVTSRSRDVLMEMQMQSSTCIVGQLKGLPEEKVREITQRQFAQQQVSAGLTRCLQKPINLALLHMYIGLRTKMLGSIKQPKNKPNKQTEKPNTVTTDTNRAT